MMYFRAGDSTRSCRSSAHWTAGFSTVNRSLSSSALRSAECQSMDDQRVMKAPQLGQPGVVVYEEEPAGCPPAMRP